MPSAIELSVQRLGTVADQLLGPAVIRCRLPIADVSIFQPESRLNVKQALTGNYEPVAPGLRWGPVWSTAWFRIRGQIPTEWSGRSVDLRFSSGTEAAVWFNGVVCGGLDVNHDTVNLVDSAVGGERLEILVEAACNRPLGATFFWWDEPEAVARWAEDKPGRLDYCEFVVIDRAVWRLRHQVEFARQLLQQLPSDSQRVRRLIDGLDALTTKLDSGNIVDQAGAASDELTRLLRGGGGAQTRSTAVGHAHIDTAWLWPLVETRRKCARTFATALNSLKRYPGFRFAATQAQQYAWIEADYPELFERIRAAVASGGWEPSGGMWIEPDCNVPSGESLIRQIIHGTRYFRERFGAAGNQTYAFLPDTFGFSGICPQIFRQAGLQTFITNKLIWSDANEFPHINFVWRGIDGTSIVSHCTPGRDYNSQLTPKELLRGERDMARMDGSGAGLWLQPFGHGDGGGGPTTESIERAGFAADCEGLSRMSLGRIDDFCRELHAARDVSLARTREWPVWDGELYLEYHRGTLTTIGWLKRANREAEHRLRTVEYLTSASPGGGDLSVAHAERLDETWKKLLLNQFHDILPGSSIKEVYDDAAADHAAITAALKPIERDAWTAWCRSLDTRGMRRPLAIFNSTSWPASGVVDTIYPEQHFVTDVPPLGVRIIDCDVITLDEAARAAIEVQVEPRALQNNRLRAEFDDAGRISLLRTLPDGRTWSSRPLNQLVLYDDRPRAWEAWDIDREHLATARLVDQPAKFVAAVGDQSLRGEIMVTRKIGQASSITHSYVLAADSPRLDIRMTVDWKEERTLLRATFPVDVQSTRATYDLSMGFIERPTHANTSWDKAKFEVCAHRWMDLSEHGGGVAILNDGKYGHSCHGNVMGLTLLRSPMFPFPNADKGLHQIVYSIMPHAGDWRTAGVDRQAALLNDPLISIDLQALAGEDGGLPAARRIIQSSTWAPVSIEVTGTAAVEVTALKRAEDGDGLILRLAETHGGRGMARILWNVGGKHVTAVDLLERSNDGSTTSELPAIRHDSQGRITTVPLRPFGIVTLRSSGS